MTHPNPYLAGRLTANDRYSDLAKGKRNWQVVAGLFALLAAGSNVATYALVHQRTVEVVIAQIDPQGQILQTYKAGTQELVVPDTTLIGAELARWIREARAISADWQHQKESYNSLYTKVSGAAKTTLTAYYTEHSPQEIASDFTISVQPTSLLRVSEQTWQIVWTERKAKKLNGEEVSVTTWRAFVTVERRPVASVKSALENPLGLYVTHLTWAQDENQEVRKIAR